MWRRRFRLRRPGSMRLLLLLLFAAAADDFESSGRIVGICDLPSERLKGSGLIAPGSPPVLSFRYFDASDRGRFGNLGLMTDDAGH
jgi:hypothetical protein